MAKLLPPQTRHGLLPEARRVVLPEGIASTSAPAIIAVAARLGLALDPWQQDVARILWARSADGSLASDTVAMSIPRQAGKTYAIAAMVFAHCVMTSGVTVAWTAHHGRVMLETFAALRATASRDEVRPHIKQVRSGAEDRAIRFANGSRIVMVAREHGALRGVAKVSILVLDEAQILTESAMSDMLPTQNQGANPLTIMMGTPPRPKDPGEVFAQQRTAALAAEKSGTPLDLAAWIEFSADETAGTDDKTQWRLANPSYPHRTPLRAMNKLRRSLSEDHFRREALGIWDDTATPMVIPPALWQKVADPTSKAVRKLVLAVDICPERTHASVALAGLRSDGAVHVELDEAREGTGWILDWIKHRYEHNPIAGVVVDARGPASSLTADLRKARIRLLATTADDMANACAEFYDSVHNDDLNHIGQTQLTRSLHSARKRAIGDRWAWNRKSADSDITPIVAVTLAHWGVLSRKLRDRPPGKQPQGGALW